MTISFRPLHPVFAAEAINVDLSTPLSAEAAAQLEAGLNQYAVLLIRGQPLTQLQQMQIGEALGPIEARPASVGMGSRRLADERMNDISNLGADGKLLARDNNRRLFNLGNRLWHTDSSFKPIPAKYSMLYGKQVPETGGDTEFADMRAAWDRLDPALQEQVFDLVAMHSLLYSRALLGFTEFSAEERARYEPVAQRLVRRIPGSGRLALYLAAHIGEIQQMLRPEAMVLVRELMEHATDRELVYRHQWQTDDLVIWDNRCTMHRATRFDDAGLVRDMRRVTIADYAPSLEQPRQ